MLEGMILNFFCKGDSTILSIKLYTINEVIHDTITCYRINYIPERYNENLLRSTNLTFEEINHVIKKLNLIQ